MNGWMDGWGHRVGGWMGNYFCLLSPILKLMKGHNHILKTFNSYFFCSEKNYVEDLFQYPFLMSLTLSISIKQGSHLTSDRLRDETKRNGRGSCHLTKIVTLAIQPLTLHDSFLACDCVSEIFEHVQNVMTASDF